MRKSPFVGLDEARVKKAQRAAVAATGKPYPPEGRGLDDMSLQDLHQARKLAVTYGGLLLKKAEADKRELSDDENLAWEDLHATADNLTDEIDWRAANGSDRGTSVARGDLQLPGSGFEARETFVGGFNISRGRRDRPQLDAAYIDATTGRPLLSLRSNENLSDFVAPRSEAERGVTLDGLLRAATGVGRVTEVDQRALSMTSDATGLITVPQFLLPGVIDLYRSKTRCIQAGARTIMVDGHTKIARVATDPTIGWKAEAASQSPEATMAMEGIDVVPRTLRGTVLGSQELFQDSANINQAISTAIAGQFAVQQDLVCLAGRGSSQNEPTGLRFASGVLSQDNGGTTSAVAKYTPLITAIRTLYEANAGTPTAMIMSPRTWAGFANLSDSTGQPLRAPSALESIPMLETTSVVNTDDDGGSPNNTSRIYMGDFNEMAIALRLGLTIQVLRERYSENYQIGLLCAMRMDVILFRPSAFLVLRGMP